MAKLWKRDNVWYVKYRDIDGRWKKTSCGKDATKKDAEVILRDYIARELNTKHNTTVRTIKLSLLEALTIFKDEILPAEQKSRNSILREQLIVDNLLNYTQGRWTDFKDVRYTEYQEYRSESVGKNTLNKERKLHLRFFNWAINQHYTTTNPAQEAPAFKLQAKHPRYLTKEEISRLMPCTHEPWTSAFQFMLNTGIRSGELANLQWHHWNRESNTLAIECVDGDNSTGAPGCKHKGKEQSIPLNATALYILARIERKSNYIFLNEAGRPLKNGKLARALWHSCKRAGMPPFGPHVFRHTFASHLVIQGTSLYIVRDLLRHSSIKQTELYAHLSNEATAQAVSNLSL